MESFALQIGKNKILNLYPSVKKELWQKVENAFCPFKVGLPEKLHQKINKTVAEFIEFKKSLNDTWEFSISNSLDFHYSAGELKIIEANTNASGYILSNLLLEKEESVLNYEKKLLQSFLNKLPDHYPKKIYIADEKPSEENMYAEFLMYQDFFKRGGLDSEIIKTEELRSLTPPFFVYNRDNDFELEKRPWLKELWKKNEISLSTSPLSYKNIAAKDYEHDIQSQLFASSFENLKKAHLRSYSLTKEKREELWGQRKKLFFKPAKSYGGKGVYAGKSISRKKFDSFDKDYIAQERHEAGKITFADQEWKYDIRAFFSESEVQKVIARVYQGQVTNFQNPGGGFALIDWIR